MIVAACTDTRTSASSDLQQIHLLHESVVVSLFGLVQNSKKKSLSPRSQTPDLNM